MADLTVLVLAGCGYVGQFIVKELAARPGLSVHATYHNLEPSEALHSDAKCHRLDTTDPQQVKTLLDEVSPDVVINCSVAQAGVCEKDPEGAERVNCPGDLVKSLGAKVWGSRTW
eukprot:gnl/TRDRNA2_/TRDRNA2_146684_c1_seq1.p1 gnl/TRDRNA2_/TRDRNA2_146684_c1~~gnl/TRDRNA2_/TRDRNA2_146684_c1_seq1.p1  ORF type:complete len:127 (-),score=25.15 gnl/TRDRNA2_/TRDRNA2_146684_c1_seq1:46-390(-)